MLLVRQPLPTPHPPVNPTHTHTGTHYTTHTNTHTHTYTHSKHTNSHIIITSYRKLTIWDNGGCVDHSIFPVYTTHIITIIIINIPISHKCSRAYSLLTLSPSPQELSFSRPLHVINTPLSAPAATHWISTGISVRKVPTVTLSLAADLPACSDDSTKHWASLCTTPLSLSF